LAFETVKRLAGLLQTMKIRVIGVVENMEFAHSSTMKKEIETLGLTFLGGIPFDEGIEEALGKPDELLGTVFAEKVRQLALRI
jgi:Mrp family chromosome partitioning ATPase